MLRLWLRLRRLLNKKKMSISTCGGCQPTIPQSPAGANGKNAYTFLANSFVQPAVSANVTITVLTSGQFTNAWAVPGQNIAIENGGEYEVVAKVGINQITVTNLGITGNATPGATVASGGGVSPSGKQGEAGTGTPGTNGIARIYSNTSTVSTASTGTGTLSLTAAVAADTLDANNKGLKVTMYWKNDGSSILQTGLGITFATQDTITGLSAGVAPLYTQGGGFSGVYTLEIVRTGTTTATAYTSISAVESGGSVGSTFTEQKLLTGLDFTIANNFGVKYTQATANDAIVNGFFVDLIQY